MYTTICRRIYLPFLDLSRRAAFTKVLAEAEINQHLSPDELAALQLRKLRQIVAHAEANCPYYRDTFKAASVRAVDLRDTSDIRKFPLLSKQEVFDQGERMRSPVYGGKLFSAKTSGSTGIALRFHQDSTQYTWASASQWRGRRWWGVNRWDRQLTLWGRPLGAGAPTAFWVRLKYRLRNTVQFNTFEEFDEPKVQRIVDVIRAFKPKLIYSYGSSLAKIVGSMSAAGIRIPASGRPRMAEYTADHMYEDEIAKTLDTLGVPAVSAYGASEAPAISQQCMAGNSHIAVDNVLVEFLKPDGEVAKAGEPSEIVVTTLNNFGMPLIRYRVGDIGSFSEGKCTCGVNLPLMELKSGKGVELITTSTRKAVSAHALDYINLYLIRQNIRGVRQFFVEQRTPDEFELSVVRQEPFDPRAVEVFTRMMREQFGEQIAINTRFVEDIPVLASGKRHYFKRSFQHSKPTAPQSDSPVAQ